MIINSLKMTGFCQFENETIIHFTDGQNLIIGDNNVGKTTILRAIVYAFTGRDIDGSDRVDELVNRNCTNMQVEVNSSVGDREHTVARSRDISKKSAVSKVYLNGEPAKDIDIYGLIGDEKAFLVAFWPLYIHVLAEEKDSKTGENAASKLLRSLVKPVSEAEVLAEMIEEQRGLLEGISLLDPVQKQKELRQQLKDTDESITRLKGKVDVYNQTIAAVIPPPVPRLTKEVEELSNAIAVLTAGEKPVDLRPYYGEVDSLKAQYDRIAASIKDLPAEPKPGICATCGQQMSNIAFGQVMKKHQSDIAEIDAKNKKLHDEAAGIVKKAKTVKDQIAAIEKKNAALTDPEVANADKLKDLRNRLAELKTQDAAAERQNSDHVNMTKAKAEAEKNKASVLEEIKKLQADKPNTEDQITALGEYVAKKAELMLGQLKKHLKNVDLQLYEVVKSTGEMKPSFSFKYTGQRKTVSQSDTIRSGLEFYHMLKTLTGRDYPTFIDNAESITSFNQPTGQWFEARPEKGKPLTVNGQVVGMPPHTEPHDHFSDSLTYVLETVKVTKSRKPDESDAEYDKRMRSRLK